jgi:DNA-binding HxlR family transcriptional regulator
MPRATFVFNQRAYTCPVELALSAVQGKWKVLILWNLRDETLRYGEIRRRLPRVTHKMLAQQLRELEADGLLNRTVYPQVPPRVDYALTELGLTLVPILREMQQWGMRFKA